MTYQKINNSRIDFIIEHEDGMLSVVFVSDSNTNKPPKVFKGFHERYGHRVKRYIKTTPLLAYQGTIYDKEFFCLPHFMIQSLL